MITYDTTLIVNKFAVYFNLKHLIMTQVVDTRYVARP